jgi:DNA-binding response OmpR family regulator
MSLAATFGHWLGEHLATGEEPEPQQSANGGIVAGNFRLEFASRSAYVDEQKLSLTPAEFDLLRFLITHRKMLVTPYTALSTACNELKIRRTAFIRNLFSLKHKLDEAAGNDRYLHIEPWVLYHFDLTGGDQS